MDVADTSHFHGINDESSGGVLRADPDNRSLGAMSPRSCFLISEQNLYFFPNGLDLDGRCREAKPSVPRADGGRTLPESSVAEKTHRLAHHDRPRQPVKGKPASMYYVNSTAVLPRLARMCQAANPI